MGKEKFRKPFLKETRKKVFITLTLGRLFLQPAVSFLAQFFVPLPQFLLFKNDIKLFLYIKDAST
jgi:hypothetical protein